MRSAPSRRCLILAVALVSPLSPACSLLVATDGLGGGGAPGADSGDLFLDGGAPRGDASQPPSTPDADARAQDDVGAERDAGFGADTGADTAGPQSDGALDTGLDGSVPHTDAGDATACAGDLSHIGTADFRVAFILRTTQSGRAAILNQRVACSPGTFWDLRFASGKLEMETDDGAHYSDLLSTGPDLNDGAPHSVLVARIGGKITIFVDGVASGSSGSSASFGALSPLASGVDVCDGKDGTAPFQGTLSGVCIGSP